MQEFEEDEELIHIQQWALTEGRLKVTLLECSRYGLCFLFTTCGQESMIEMHLKTVYVYSGFMLVYIVLFYPLGSLNINLMKIVFFSLQNYKSYLEEYSEIFILQ